MAFPITIKYSKTFNDNINNEKREIIINYINDYVIDKKADNILKNNYSVTIRTSILGWNWRTFASIDKGIFTVWDNKLTYEFSMYWLFIIVPIFSLLISYSSKNIKIGIFLFVFLGLGNWIMTKVKQKKIFDELIQGLQSEKNIN